MRGFRWCVTLGVIGVGAWTTACSDSNHPLVERQAVGGASGETGDAAGGAGGTAGGAGHEREIDAYFLGNPPNPGGLAPTPPMGWNSWNEFSTGVNENLIHLITDAIVDSGMRDAGYRYVNIDDGWSQRDLDADGNLLVVDAAFPSGMQGLADHIHDQGLKIGIYGDRGTATCGNRAGSQGNEVRHAQQYADWGIDYLKQDNCNAQEDRMEEQYGLMAEALKDSGRDIVYSICAWWFYEWSVGMGHLWRTTGDIKPEWDSIMRNFLATRTLAPYAGPNGWNDPDMLEVGNEPASVGKSLSVVEHQAHFSVWSILAAPLIAGNDLRRMDGDIKDILTNPEVIALNQDPLGLQAAVVKDGNLMVLAKPLWESGARGVVLLNRSASPATIRVRLEDLGLAPGSASVRDLVAHQDLETVADEISMSVRSHEAVTLKVVGNEPAIPEGNVYLSDLAWTYASNALGPIERDQSAGGSDVDDGDPIALDGDSFDKGLGMSGPAMVIYRLGQACSSFNAVVGVDDVTEGQGSVTVEVWGDEQLLWQSDGVLTPETGPQMIDVDVSGQHRLKIKVLNGGDGSGWDRVSFGNAELSCD